MGCRAATALARQLSDESEEPVRGVICLSFPLHPPGQTRTHRQRGEDLRALPEDVPVLFVSGTEDNMCDRVRMVGGLFILTSLQFYTFSYGIFILYLYVCVCNPLATFITSSCHSVTLRF